PRPPQGLGGSAPRRCRRLVGCRPALLRRGGAPRGRLAPRPRAPAARSRTVVRGLAPDPSRVLTREAVVREAVVREAVVREAVVREDVVREAVVRGTKGGGCRLAPIPARSHESRRAQRPRIARSRLRAFAPAPRATAS